MELEKLSDVVQRLQDNSYTNNVVKRGIVRASKCFRPKSSNDVKHHTYLAMCLYVIDDVENAKAILHALDRETAIVEDRMDLAGELAISRIFLAQIYGLEGNAKLRNEIINRDDIVNSQNLENIDYSYDIKFDNALQEDISNCYDGIKQLKYDSSPRRERLWLAYECYKTTVIYTERLNEIQDKISKDDTVELAKALSYFQDKFTEYLNQ